MPQYISILLDENEILREGDILIFQDSNCCGIGQKIGPHQVMVMGWEGHRVKDTGYWLDNYGTFEIIAAVRLYSFDEIDYYD